MCKRRISVSLVLGLTASCLVAAERPAKTVRVDATKVVRIETSIERLVVAGSGTTARPGQPGKTAFRNPKVEPGKVRWHKNFEAACAAARKSGKPVLLFQLMGKLDDRFC